MGRVTRSRLLEACDELSGRDADLAGVLCRHGPPPLWARRPGFATLVQIILEQQVSLVSARAALARLQAHADPLTPARVLALGDTRLRAAGLTRQKSRYLVELADRVATGALDLRRVGRSADDDARAMLCAVPGIGAWTADVYLVMALRRPDVWPTADLALEKAVQRLKRLRARPDPARLARITRAWRPWRAVAARIAWHDYLSR